MQELVNVDALLQSNPVNCIVNIPSLFMQLNEFCIYAKVRSRTEAQQSSRIKTSTCHTSKQAQCDCLILAQKVNKNMQIKGLIEFYLFQAKYCAIAVCLILFCMLSCIFLSS